MTKEPDRTVRPKDKLSGADAMAIYQWRRLLEEIDTVEELSDDW